MLLKTRHPNPFSGGIYNIASHLYLTLAHRRPTFIAEMTTYYCPNMEEALRRAKKAGREPGCYFGGITLRSGRRGFAVYRDGKVVAQYTAIGPGVK